MTTLVVISRISKGNLLPVSTSWWPALASESWMNNTHAYHIHTYTQLHMDLTELECWGSKCPIHSIFLTQIALWATYQVSQQTLKDDKLMMTQWSVCQFKTIHQTSKMEITRLLPCFTMVMVFYHYVEIIWIILINPHFFCITYTMMK